MKKKFMEKGKELIVKGAIKIAKLEINTACPFISYQEPLPKALKDMMDKNE